MPKKKQFVVPSPAKFNKWWDDVSYKEFTEAWETPEEKERIERALRKNVDSWGGNHEWYMVKHGLLFKEWGAESKQLKAMTQSIDELNECAVNWEHGGDFSGTFHKELEEIILKSRNLRDYKKRVVKWVDDLGFLKQGSYDLPEFFIS